MHFDLDQRTASLSVGEFADFTLGPRDALGGPALFEPDNPNGSSFAIEGLTSSDGRILGKMGHSERCGEFVHVNIPGNKVQRIFAAGVRYFS